MPKQPFRRPVFDEIMARDLPSRPGRRANGDQRRDEAATETEGKEVTT